MKLLKLELHADEPIIATAGSSEGMAHNCLDHIPGNMLLGAFASVWKSRNKGVTPDESPVFQRLFLDGSVSWGDGRPLCGENPTIPVPLCFMREKNMDGLPVAGTAVAAGKAAVFNPLALKDEEKLAPLYRKEILGLANPEDDSGVSPPKFKKLAASFMDPETWRQPDLHQVWNTRVALGAQRSARRGLLFGFSALGRGSRFQADIYCEDEAAEDLRALLASLDAIHLGHSRSSGYGLAAITPHWSEAAEPEMLEGRQFNLFLLSHYFPQPAWQEPLANLQTCLKAKFGMAPQLADRIYLAWERLEGFNCHWGGWRDTRKGIAKGSVIPVVFAEPLSLPRAFTLGAGNLEGYGRIMINPEFLEQPLHICATSAAAAKTAANTPAPDLAAPIWRILRKRALARQAAKLANHWLAHERWRNFLEKASRLKTPSANQRANALGMAYETFEKMLDKTPGKQWKNAVTPNPFNGLPKDHLSAVMLTLLHEPNFLAAWQKTAGDDFWPEGVRDLPGGGLREQEEKELQEAAYKLFKRELIRAWGKLSRIGQSDGKQEK